MIRFFRNIRQNLLAQGRVVRYLTYAIGEILLVVIGILIALQVNMWNEQRKLAKEEQLLLIQLRKDFNSDLKGLDTKIASGSHIIASSVMALTYMDDPVGVNRDTLFKKLGAILGWPTFNPTKNDALISGGLHLIRNEQLKVMLSQWPTEVSQGQEAEQEIERLYFDVILPFTIDFGIAREMIIAFFNDSANLGFLLDKQSSKRFRMGRSNKAPALEEILNSAKLEGILMNTMTINELSNWESQSLRERINEILNVLDQEIKE